MSFILQLFHAPKVKTLGEAEAFVRSPRNGTFEDHERFESFVKAITAVYPDLSDEDEDGDDDRNVWGSGISAGTIGKAVLVISLKTELVELELMMKLADVAAKSGLHVLDPQNALLFRDDHHVVNARGVATQLRRAA
jgi:hypothetical protein